MQISARSSPATAVAQALVGDMNDRRGLEARADALLRTLDFQRAGDDAAHAADLGPARRQGIVAPFRRHVREGFEMHGFRLRIAREPGLLGREGKDRRDPGRHRAERDVDHRSTLLRTWLEIGSQ